MKLKVPNTTLENFRCESFVACYRQMEVELGNYSKDNSALLRQLEQQELKLKATTRELMKERQFVS